MILIGLSGKKQSGKSTAALHLDEQHSFCIHAIATPFKIMLQVLGIPFEALEDAKLKEQTLRELDILPIDISPRTIMQSAGDWGRKTIHPQLWSMSVEMRIRESAKRHERQLVTDIRTEDEAKLIRNMGGIVAHIDRPGLTNNDQHLTEQGIKYRQGDIKISNDKGINELHNELDTLVALSKLAG